MAFRVSKHAQEKGLRPKPKPSFPVSRPTKEASKPKVTISTASILRRKPLKEVYGKRYSRRRGRVEPENDLFLDYQEQVELSRDELLTSSRAAVNQIHSQLTDNLKKLHLSNTTFEADLRTQTTQIFRPLTEESIETVFNRDGKSITEIMQIGPRVEAFNAMLANKEIEVAKCWAEWEKVQAKILELGVDVLGAEALGMQGKVVRKRVGGYAVEMEGLEREHAGWLEEIQEEIHIIGRDAMNQMIATEKEQNSHWKREQATLIANLFASDEEDD